MSHLLADSLDELHTMADTVGLKRKWFQTNPIPHYDLCKSYRIKAISFGAKEIGRKETVTLIRSWKEKLKS